MTENRMPVATVRVGDDPRRHSPEGWVTVRVGAIENETALERGDVVRVIGTDVDLGLWHVAALIGPVGEWRHYTLVPGTDAPT